MASSRSTADGWITVTEWYGDWHVCIQIGSDVGTSLWLTRKEAEALPAQIARALADRDRNDSSEEA